MQLINIGFGNIVSAERIISIVSPESAPIKRIIQETEITKEDMKTLTKIALGEIEEGCLEYDRICDRMINYSIEIEED